MNRKSRLRSKASYQYKPEEVKSEQNPVQPVNPVYRTSIPEKKVDADMLIPTASTKQVRQVTAIENAGTRKKGYRTLGGRFDSCSHQFLSFNTGSIFPYIPLIYVTSSDNPLHSFSPMV